MNVIVSKYKIDSELVVLIKALMDELSEKVFIGGISESDPTTGHGHSFTVLAKGDQDEHDLIVTYTEGLTVNSFPYFKLIQTILDQTETKPVYVHKILDEKKTDQA